MAKSGRTSVHAKGIHIGDFWFEKGTIYWHLVTKLRKDGYSDAAILKSLNDYGFVNR